MAAYFRILAIFGADTLKRRTINRSREKAAFPSIQPTYHNDVMRLIAPNSKVF